MQAKCLRTAEADHKNDQMTCISIVRLHMCASSYLCLIGFSNWTLAIDVDHRLPY